MEHFGQHIIWLRIINKVFGVEVTQKENSQHFLIPHICCSSFYTLLTFHITFSLKFTTNINHNVYCCCDAKNKNFSHKSSLCAIKYCVCKFCLYAKTYWGENLCSSGFRLRNCWLFIVNRTFFQNLNHITLQFIDVNTAHRTVYFSY